MALFAALAVVVPLGAANGQNAGPPAVPVEAEEVRVETITREIEAVGTLRSNESVVIRPEMAGRIAEIAFQEGTPVAEGQVLVRLDDATLRAQLAQAEANLGLSKANSERAQRLYRQGVTTERARDEAAARLLADEAAIALARAQLAKTVIRAPFDGIIGLRHVSAGAYVTPGQDIANLEDVDPVKVDFRVPEVFLSSVAVGQKLGVTADAFPDRSFQGAIYAIDPVIDEAGRSILVRARIPNSEGILRPGLFVRVRLVIEEVQNAVTVPEQALMPTGEKILAFKIVEGKAQPVPVETGLRRGGRVEVRKGLAAGDVVVTAGHMKLRPGTPVAVVGPGSES